MSRLSVNVVTLGCSKNLVDSEFLLKHLVDAGFQVEHDSNNPSDVVIINTCGFINDAKEESLDTVFQFIKAKQEGLVKKIIVFGCLTERYRVELKNELKEVDHLLGLSKPEDIVKLINEKYLPSNNFERILTSPGHYAYLKVADGCDRTCAFCAIPLIKGAYVSRPMEEIVNEARILSLKGVKELILVAQDLTYYGVDLYKKQVLAVLLTKLSEIDGIQWIRLQYAYPASFPMDVLDVMKNNPKVCRYMDIPFQHVSDKMLKLMKRNVSKKDIYKLIETFREKIPNLVLRTTLLVGHPGEDETDVEELMQFVRDVRFERLGVFTYSHEDGTYSCLHFEDIIPEEIKQERMEKLMELQSEISFQLNKEKEGKRIRVMIDREEEDFYVGRTEYDSPEVDNEVFIQKSPETKLNVGFITEVTIYKADSYELYGKV